MSDPTAALRALLEPNSLSQTTFPPTSRYAGVPIAVIERADGTPVAYVRRRLIPQPEQYALIQEHSVTEGERLDILAARFLGDPELFWRICDANAALSAEELEAIGRVLRITLPAGLPGAGSEG